MTRGTDWLKLFAWASGVVLSICAWTALIVLVMWLVMQ